MKHLVEWRAQRRAGMALTLLAGMALALSSPPTVGADPPLGQDAGYVSSFEVTGAVQRPRTYTLADLQALPVVEVVHDCYVEPTGPLQTHAYRGVSLWGLLTEADIKLPPGPSDGPLRGYVGASDP